MHAGIGVVLLRPAPSNNTDIRGGWWVLGLITLVFDDVRPSRKQLRYMLCAVLMTVLAHALVGCLFGRESSDSPRNIVMSGTSELVLP